MNRSAPARLPGAFLWTVIAVCVMPTLLNWCGADFSVQGKALDASTVVTSIDDTPDLLRTRTIQGPLVHTLLEWSAFCVALVTVVFSFIHFTVRLDAAAPIIGAAMFASGMIDAFNILAASGLVLQVSDYRYFVPFTWAISRQFNIVIMIAGASLFLRRRPNEPLGGARRSVRFIVLVGILFTLIAYVIIQTCAFVPRLPQSLFPEAVVPRPWDAVPLILYILAGGIIFPRFHLLYPGLFSHALIICVIPQIATQLHAAFGSRALYDNHFNIAYFLKIVAYVVPLAGLIWEYTRTYQVEVQLRAAQKNLQIARDIQLDMLPQSAPQLAGFDLAGGSYPAEEVGGDYFDYIPMPDGCLGLVTADVTGHDIGASIFMTQTRAYLRALARTRSNISQIIRLLNEFLIEDARNDRFVALFFAKLNPRTRRLTYCPAGYMSYLLDRAGAWQKLESNSLPLGIVAEGETAPATEMTLETSDLFLSFTDGVIEALNPEREQFGLERTLETVRSLRERPAAEIVAAVYDAIEKFSRGAHRSDDMTVLVLRCVGRKS